VEVHVTDHCNLNCCHCSHFSPLAKEKFLDIELFENDCKRLAKLSVSNEKVSCLRLLGGEPLLHPRLPDIFEVARKYLNDMFIMLVTNGILLSKQKESFWESCQRNKIVISISNYPIKIDFDEIIKLGKKYSVTLDLAKLEKNGWNKSPLDLQGKQNLNGSHKDCSQKTCFQLCEGKMYVCPVITYISSFNNYFNQNLEITENDYIDIYKAKSMKEIVDFLHESKPFCRYCNVKGNVLNVEWKLSKKEITEWI
jgi:MoaA/NifB/PqqE/SkfB family radical SAM enzyme